jgi:GNAT superfamily N-acetyltransferase
VPVPTQPPVPDRKHYRIRPLKRGDRDAAFKLLAADGWIVPANDQELTVSWIVQHPEVECLVAHDAAAFSRLFGIITMSHRPQLQLGGRVSCIDLFLVAPEQRHKGIGDDLLTQALRRSEALGCKRVEVNLAMVPGDLHAFFAGHGFHEGEQRLFIRPAPPAEKK